jgi:CubicO group peptidase (beta-lactamase class C family)
VNGLRGVVVVVRDGVPVVEAAGPGCSLSTRFQIASVSKQFAAVVALILAEQGALDLHEPITRWFTEAPADWRGITLHHLLTHTSGIGHWADIPGFVPSEAMDLDKRLALFQRAPLISAPGTEFRYSSPGYLLVGDIVGRAAGRPYVDLLRQWILEPLNLSNTNTGPPPAGAEVARGHRNGEPVTAWDLASMAGTGDIWATAGDLTRFTVALHTGALLAEGAYRAMITPRVAIDERRWYGYGMYLGPIAGLDAHYHTGDNPGFLALTARLPDDTSLTVLSNDEVTDIEEVARDALGTEGTVACTATGSRAVPPVWPRTR